VQVGISLVLCGIAFGYMLSKGESVKHALQFTVVLLVASIPLAIEIVVTATLALGSRELSAQGAIVTRLPAIEEMAGMNMLCSDKTGTLTLNKMVIQVQGWLARWLAGWPAVGAPSRPLLGRRTVPWCVDRRGLGPAWATLLWYPV
jgi:P-type E1-E2 ATPase